jgi:ribosomal protein S18 acetylase RimI-like enzyme
LAVNIKKRGSLGKYDEATFMNINVIKAEDRHLADCAAAVLDSELGDVYFKDRKRAVQALTRGISRGEIFVAVNNDLECLGFIWVNPSGMFDKFPYLHMIAVRREYRGIGIGKILIRYFEDNYRNDGSKAFLVVADFNPKAKTLYESLGYKEVGVIPGLYKEGVAESLMMKEL